MKEHQLCLKHLETKGPTTRVAFVGAVAAAAHGMSCSIFDSISTKCKQGEWQVLGTCKLLGEDG